MNNEELHDLYSSVNIVHYDHIENGRACSTYGVEERCIQGFVGNLRERGHLGDLGLHGRIILK
jgi:hypothetical protein